MNEPNEKLEQLREQNKQYADAYWDVYDNKEAVPANQQECMRAELLKNYNRAVALFDGQEGLDKEREIADLEIKQLQIQEDARLRKAELSERYRLKHVKLKEKTDTEAARIEKEFEILRHAEKATLEVKEEQIVPVKEELPRNWLQRLFRRPVRYYTNYAYELASRKADLEADKYFAARADEILKLEAEQTGTDELKLAVMKVMSDYTGGEAKGRKAKAINKAFSEIIGPLCEIFARREKALNDLIGHLSENADNVFEEPTEQGTENISVRNQEAGREELQRWAVTLLSEFCQKRIDDLQQAQKKKPKRQRVRKTRPDIEGG